MAYAIVGTIATAAHFLCLYTLVDILEFLKPIPASIVAFLCGATIGFVCNRIFVFKRSKVGLEELSKYLILIGFSGINNTLLMYALIKMLNWHYLAAQLFATGCIFLINFAICKYWIFKEPAYVE